MHYPKKSALSKLLSHPGSLTISGLIILVLISIPLYKNIKKQISINNEIGTLKNEIKNLEGKNTELKGLISYLNSDEFAEEQARLNLNYKKKGEQVLVIKNKGEEEEKPEGSENPSESIYGIKGLENKAAQGKKSNARKWVDYFLQ